MAKTKAVQKNANSVVWRVRVKINEKRFFVKNTNNVEQVVLPKIFKRLVFEELNGKVGQECYYRVLELLKVDCTNLAANRH